MLLLSEQHKPFYTVSQTQGCAGWIDAIQGHVYWKQNATSKPVLLNLRQDKFRRLYAGECVKVNLGGTLKMSLYGRTTELKGPSGWYPVPLVHTHLQTAQMQVLSDYARIGGRERKGSFIFSPASESVVRPEDLIVRWTGQEFKGAVTVILQDNDGNTLWHQSDVDGALGTLTSDALCQALLNYRTSGNRRQLVLEISSPDGNSAQSTFTLLSDQDSQALGQDLLRWDHETGFLRHLGRVDAFAARGMVGDVAHEYDLALVDAPESRDLLQSAITAQERIGNAARVRELTQRLAASGASSQSKKVQSP